MSIYISEEFIIVVFLDTGFILTTRNFEDTNQIKAVELMKKCLTGKYGKIIITNLVFDKIVTLILLKIHDKKLAEDIGRFVFESPRINMIHLS